MVGRVIHRRYGWCTEEIAAEDAEVPAKGLFFVARDAYGTPCLWRHEGDSDPTCLLSSGGALDSDVWLLIASHPETQTSGFECSKCGVFVLDADPADPDHLATVARHRKGRCRKVRVA